MSTMTPSAATEYEAWSILCEVPQAAMPAFETALEVFDGSISSFEVDHMDPKNDRWRIEVFLDEPPNKDAVDAAITRAAETAGIATPSFEIVAYGKRNWLAENLEAFPPLTIGRYFVYGSHYEGEVPQGKIGILVDAATAFGTGRHDSTRGCLLAFEKIAKRKAIRRPLDMGCGSGVLAMGLVKTFGCKVVAADIDPESVRVTKINARINGVGPMIKAYTSTGFQSPAVRKHGPYDLIAANILARPLVNMAPALCRAVAPGGRVVLAGLMREQEKMVLSAYQAQGLRLVEAIRLNEWTTLLLKKKG